MASTNSLSSHLEDLRSRNPQSPPSENVYNGYSTPTRYSGSFLNANPHAGQGDARASLTRRMTADANLFNAFSSMTQQPSLGVDVVDMSASTLYKVQALEKKRLELEKTREQRRRFDAELEKFNRQQAQEERELQQMASDLQTMNFTSGHQSEPTTPPEYRDPNPNPSFPSMYSRRNRYSSSNIMSPPSAGTRLSRSSSQMTSPPKDLGQSQQSGSDSDKLPSKSVPGSRRSSSDRFSSYLAEMSSAAPPRTTPRANRYSMPVQRSKRESVPEFGSSAGLGHINTTKFLFGDDDEEGQKGSTASPPDVKTYLHMNTTDDKFPILVRNNTQPSVLSASSAAPDLASPNQETGTDWPTSSAASRHRHSQQSLPQNFFDPAGNKDNVGSPSSSSQQTYGNNIESPTALRKPNRHSMEASLASLNRNSMFAQTQPSTAGTSRPALANFQSSYSTNDIPTLKNHEVGNSGRRVSPPTSQSNQQFHNHNASLGRIPPGSAGNRLSRDASTLEPHREEPASPFNPTGLESQPMSSGPSVTSNPTSVSSIDASAALLSTPGLQQYANSAYYGNYGMQMLNMGLSPMQMGNPTAYNNQISMYQAQQNPYGGFPGYQQPGRVSDSQARVIQQRRMQNAEEIARFTNAKIENYRGEIYSLCKDQHGCRYLQKQLETRNPETVHLIFLETQNHVVELMTDPFGNYLCQKLLEHSNDAQRTVLVDNAAPEMVKIALNQHGTRALQKMIEFISTPEQIQTIIHALKDKVVELIQDLNGNHVIQKCLNRLSSGDAQFIFDAVGAHCVVVGTHRHGCCVLQRCIDHASGPQKAALIAQITANAFALVQDPFGNYVLQYIVDLNEPQFTTPLCQSFAGSIPALSKQKFSSNVIEKCLRHADGPVGAQMISQMLDPYELEKMLRDSYANYVVQTALDFGDRETRAALVDVIRPILPSIRGTPYGRRIQTKIVSHGGGDVAAQSNGPPAAIDPVASGPTGNRPNGVAPNAPFHGVIHRPGYPAAGPNGFGAQAPPNMNGGLEHKTFASPPQGPAAFAQQPQQTVNPNLNPGPNGTGFNPGMPNGSNGTSFGGPFNGPPQAQQYNRMPPANGFGGGYF